MIKINNENLIDFILYKFNLEDFKQIKPEHLLKLEMIVIDGEDNANDSLQDIVMFTNLKSLTIKNININKQNFKQILTLNKLEKLEFISCNISCKEKLCNPSIKQISFISCNNFSINNLIQNINTLKIIDGKNIDLKGIEKANNLQNLYLQNLKLQDISFITNLPKLKYINLNGSTIKEEQYNLLKNSNIQVEYKKTNYEII